MATATNTNALLKQVRKALEDLGIKVDVQKAVTTTSIYVKLDGGALKSLRIGDHAGIAKYAYGYEIGSHIKHYHEFFGEINGKVFTRQKFTPNEIDMLVLAVKMERTAKLRRYGEEQYSKLRKTGKWY